MMKKNRIEILFYYSALSLGIMTIFLIMAWLLFARAFFIIREKTDGLIIEIVLFTSILFIGFFALIYLIKTFQIIIWQINKKVALIINNKGIIAAGLEPNQCFTLAWKDIESVQTRETLLIDKCYSSPANIIICRNIIVYPIPEVYQRNQSLQRKPFSISIFILKDHIDDIFKTIQDYWQADGKKDLDIVTNLQNSRRERQQKKRYWVTFFIMVAICFLGLMQL